MYQLNLSDSLISPQQDDEVKETTIGGLLREVVALDLVRKVRRAFGCEFQTVYGQTETAPLITQHHLGEELDDNQVVPIGEVGEIRVRGYCNMIGYHGNEQATAQTIDADGWLHTGELGIMDVRGYVSITGRVKEMIIRGGENLFPAEIENALLEHHAVAEVAVVGLPDDKWGEIVACFIRPEAGQAIDSQELQAYCSQHLSPQKTPVLWCAVDGFPLTGSGKIQKFALRDGYADGRYEAL